MSAINLRDGKILISGNARGLAAKCDCCDDPPPPLDCSSCCPGSTDGTLEIGDSVLIEIDILLPAQIRTYVSPQPSDNGQRIWPATQVAGEGVLFIDQLDYSGERGGGTCLSASRNLFGNFFYSSTTFSEFITAGVSLAPLNGGCFFFSSLSFEVSTLQSLQEIIDLGEGGVITPATDPDISSPRTGWALRVQDTSISGASPCSSEITYPVVLVSELGSSLYPFVDFIDAAVGDEVGTMTIRGIE